MRPFCQIETDDPGAQERSFGQLPARIIFKVYQAVAVVDLDVEQVQQRKAENAGHFGTERPIGDSYGCFCLTGEQEKKQK